MPQTDRTKCLLVDDVEENLIALEALLQRDGLDILKAQSGPEALELLLAHDDVALALLDVQMPEMNGFELAELIRGSERTRHIPLIFMTAGSREQNWQFRGYESGAVDFLYKPIDPHMLTNKASVFFELHRRKQALAHELRARTEALRINEMFMAVLSHDLRTPLQSIVAAATVLKRQPPPDKAALMVDRVLRSSQRMGHMIEDLLDVTRIRQAGGLALQLGPVHMQTLVQRTLDEVATSHPERPIDSTLAGDLAGTWDAERLCQVITNLALNAMIHAFPGHHSGVVLVDTTLMNARSPFLSASQCAASVGRSFARLAYAVTSLHAGHFASFCIARGERWNVCPLGQRQCAAP